MKTNTQTNTFSQLRTDIVEHINSYAGLPSDSEPVIYSLNKELELAIAKYDELTHIPIKVSFVVDSNIITGECSVNVLVHNLEIEI